MGVPAFFRWLSRRYPKVIRHVVEEEPTEINGIVIPVDISQPNPNGIEFDNFYLDMNGIIHPCCHPVDKPAPETEEDMMLEVFKCLDRVFAIVRPRKVIYMAIDGVAPRAKMNQQRSRRFRSAQDARIEAQKEREIRGEVAREMGIQTEAKKKFDSNCITPGTPFMDKLAKCLRYYIAEKQNADPAWRNLKVILSDASVPGEGEHKIMDFIRRSHMSPSHDPNTTHVIYGLDADLIMLALATHEPHFYVLREDVFWNQGKKGGDNCYKCGRPGHIASECTAEVVASNSGTENKEELQPFIFAQMEVLREYLNIALKPKAPLPFAFDLDRAIDDWVFLCFFVGNDFLPHLPSLEIREGALDRLTRYWRDLLPQMGGYLTDSGNVNLGRVQLLLNVLSEHEDEVFRRRKQKEDQMEARSKKKVDANGNDMNELSKTHVKAAAESDTSNQNAAKRLKSLIAGSSVNSVAVVTRTVDEHSTNGAPTTEDKGMAVELGGGAEDQGRGEEEEEEEVMIEEVMMESGIAGSAGTALRAAPMSGAQHTNEVDSSENDIVPRKRKHSTDSGSNETVKTDIEQQQQQRHQVDGLADGPAKVLVTDEKPEGIEGGDTGSEATEVEDEQQPEQQDGELADDTLKVPTTDKPLKDIEGDNTSSEAVSLKDVQTEDAEINGDVGEGDNSACEDAEADGDVRGEAEEEEEEESVTEAEATYEDDEDEVVEKEEKIEELLILSKEDNVRLWEEGYKERYYREKLGVELSDKEFIHKFVKHYVEGLCWVLQYYYQGCPSWKWYYPYHYSPFASDFEGLASMDIKFELGEPFKPFEQLMGVLPADSKENLPKAFWPLMTDADSPIIDFYPREFQIDLNGKKHAWQGVALLPFINEKRLLDAIKEVYPKLGEEAKERNKEGATHLCVAAANRLNESLCNLYSTPSEEWVALDPKVSDWLAGLVARDKDFVPHTTFLSPLLDKGKPDISEDKSIIALYKPYPAQWFQAGLLPGVKFDKKHLTATDVDFVRTNGKSGGKPSGPHGFRNDNIHDYSFFFRQQGNDVYYDRGRGPRRYDEYGNLNPAFHSTQQQQRHRQHQATRAQGYNGGTYGRGGARPPRGRGAFMPARGARGSGPGAQRPGHFHPYNITAASRGGSGEYYPHPSQPVLYGQAGAYPPQRYPGGGQATGYRPPPNATASAFYSRPNNPLRMGKPPQPPPRSYGGGAPPTRGGASVSGGGYQPHAFFRGRGRGRGGGHARGGASR